MRNERESVFSPLSREIEPRNQPLIIYAGQSNRRKAFLEHCFPKSQVINFPGGDEANTPDVMGIMHGKLDHVLNQYIDKGFRPEKNQRIALVAADIRTSVFTLNEKEIPVIESKGKQKNIEDVRKIFADMSRASEMTGIAPYYTVIAASGVQIKERKRDERLAAMHTCTIELNKDYTDYFGTEEGIKEYSQALENFYGHPSYQNNGTHSSVGVLDIASGLSLSTLTNLGAVSAIDGYHRDDPAQFRNTFIHGLHNALVGISPHLLNPIKSTTNSKIENWKWLNDIATHALSEQ